MHISSLQTDLHRDRGHWAEGRALLSSAHLSATNHEKPAYTFRGFDTIDPIAQYPGPGKYNWAKSKDSTRPAVPAQSMKFRHPEPEAKSRTPAPNAYLPTCPLAVRLGPYRAVTIKQRCDPALTQAASRARRDTCSGELSRLLLSSRQLASRA
jgi:hypothetical protein